LLGLFKKFHYRAADLERINKAHVVLLPKLTGVLTPASYRPVSLQNCSIKAICKALMTRLQRRIAAIIDVDQTGFLSGQSISEMGEGEKWRNGGEGEKWRMGEGEKWRNGGEKEKWAPEISNFERYFCGAWALGAPQNFFFFFLYFAAKNL
jgi:hypothetical protein